MLRFKSVILYNHVNIAHNRPNDVLLFPTDADDTNVANSDT